MYNEDIMNLTNHVDELLGEERKLDIGHRSSMIRFFDTHKDKLDNEDKKRIFLQAEIYRREYNKKYPNDPIRREDTKPYIYNDLSFLEAKSEQKEIQVFDY
jgi:hypothetical protein